MNININSGPTFVYSNTFGTGGLGSVLDSSILFLKLNSSASAGSLFLSKLDIDVLKVVVNRVTHLHPVSATIQLL